MRLAEDRSRIASTRNFQESVTIPHLLALPDKVPVYELQLAVIFPSIITQRQLARMRAQYEEG